VDKGYEAIAWPNAEVLMDRWSDRYAELYRTQYDKKMPSLLKKITKVQPMMVNENGEPIQSGGGTETIWQLRRKPERSDDTSRVYTGGHFESETAAEEFLQGMSEGERDNYIIEKGEVELDGEMGYWIMPITDELRSRVVAEGLPLFAQKFAEPQANGGMTEAEVRKAIQPMIDGVSRETGMRVEILHSNALPPEVTRNLPEGKVPKGAYLDRVVYLTSDTLKDAADAQVTFAHEVVGHLGVNAVVGDKWPEMRKLYQSMKSEAAADFQDIYDEMVDRYDENQNELDEVSEFIAIAAERRHKQGPVARFMSKVREFVNQGLRRLGFKRPYSVADINDILTRSERYLKTGRTPGTIGMDQWKAEQAARRGQLATMGAFESWFGGSKVVDKAGKPLVVYHGTPDARFLFGEDGQFETKKEQLGMFDPDRAFFFTDSRRVAKTYADDRRAFDYQSADPAVGELYLSIQNPMIIDAKGRSWGERGGPASQEEQVAEAKAKGHDGIIIKNTLDTYSVDGDERANVYVIFDSRQAKSAATSPLRSMFDGNEIPGSGPNRGSYDPRDPRIQYSLEDEFKPDEVAVIKHGGFGLQKRSKTYRQRFDEIRNNTKTRFRQYWIDQYDSINSITDNPRAWMKAQLAASSWGSVEAGVEFGRLGLHEDGVVTVDTDQKGLKELLAPLGADIDRFMYWIAGNRAEKLMAEGRENLFNAAQIQVLKNMGKNGKPGETGYRPDRERIFEEVRQEFEAWGAAITDIAVDTGLVNEEEAAMWREEGFYLPFYRVLEEEENAAGPRVINNARLVKQEAYKKLKGGSHQLDDLLGNALMNWNHLLSASLKNQTAREVLASAEDMGLAERVSKSKASKDALYVRVDGKEQWWELSEEPEGQLVMESLAALHYNGMQGPFWKWARKAKRAHTIGVTASPEFKVANAIRDSMQAIAVTQMNPNVVSNVVEGWKATRKKGGIYPELLASGAVFAESGYIHGADPDAIRYLVRKGVERDTILDSRMAAKKVWDKYQDFGARLENVNRAAAYQQARAAGKDRLEAAFESRDLLDFTRGGNGYFARRLASTVSFLNARIQGLDKVARSMKDPHQRQRFSARGGCLLIAVGGHVPARLR
jgi:hypothetical protein